MADALAKPNPNYGETQASAGRSRGGVALTPAGPRRRGLLSRIFDWRSASAPSGVASDAHTASATGDSTRREPVLTIDGDAVDVSSDRTPPCGAGDQSTPVNAGCAPLPRDLAPTPDRDRYGLAFENFGDRTADGRALSQHPPEDHASALFDYLRTNGDADSWPEFLTFDDVREAYLEMCAEIGWQPVAWQRVGRHFTPLTRSPSVSKPYRDLIQPDGSKRKTRVYFVPAPPRRVVDFKPATKPNAGAGQPRRAA